MPKAKPKPVVRIRKTFRVELNFYIKQKQLCPYSLREDVFTEEITTQFLLEKIVTEPYDYKELRAQVKKEAVEQVYRMLPKTLWVDIKGCMEVASVEIKEEGEDQNGN